MSLSADKAGDGAPESTIPRQDGSEALPSKMVLSTHADIPNGGLTAWLQVVGSFLLFVNSWGIIQTFGVFQTYYESELLKSETFSNISWIGSIQSFLLLLVGVLVGPVFDAGYLRTLLCTGGFMSVFGMMMTSIATEYWQVMLAQGICVGLGCGCMFVPSVAIIAQYFSTKKALATGIAATGSSFGGIIYPIVFKQLYPQIGFGWATRVLAFLMLAMLMVSVTVMKIRVPIQQKRKLLQLHAFRDIPYSCFTLGQTLGFMGLFIPFFYSPTFASSVGTGDGFAFYTITMLNGTSILGRLIPGHIADKTGPLNILIPCSVISAALCFCWIPMRTKADLIAFSLLYGFFSGSFVSLTPTALVTLCPNLSEVGTRMGMSFTLASLGLLIGNPIAGAIVTRHGFPWAQGFAGIAIALGAISLAVARVSKAGWKLKVRA